MKSIIDMIKVIDSTLPNINPTIIYNEGWMTRLLVNQSLKEKINLKCINFEKINNWTSEALISSPFVKAKTHREGYTHTDIALGDFAINYDNSGKIIINPNAKIFAVIEAKMGSFLSKSTKNADNYNQASRNLACISNETHEIKDCDIFFLVVSPEINKNKNKIDLDTMIGEIKNRFDKHGNDPEIIKNKDSIISKAEKALIFSISYEEWIDLFSDSEEKEYLLSFYKNCRRYNKIKDAL